MPRKLGRRAVPDHRRLIHLLNQRYHQEFIRAERLQADLAFVRALWATWLFRLMRRLKRWLRPARPAPLDGSVAPVALEPAA